MARVSANAFLFIGSLVCVCSPEVWACDTKVETPVERFVSAEEARQKLVGVWTLCGDEMAEPAVSPTPHDAVEVTADGAMYLLKTDANGRYVRQWGFDNEYQTSIQDYDYPLRPSFYYWRVAGDTGLQVVAPHFSTDGEAVRLTRDDASSVYRKSNLPVVVPPVDHQGVRKGHAACGQPEAIIHKEARSADDVRRLIAGAWWDCKIAIESPIVFPLLPEWAFGIRFDADGQWHYIVTEDGNVSTDPQGHGVYWINKHEEAYQIIVELPDQSKLSLIWSFSEAPVKAHLLGLHLSADENSWSIVDGTLSGM